MAHDLEKKWRSEDVQLQESVDFSALLLSDRVLFGLKKAGFKKPSPIQLEAIPISKVGKDLLVQAKSGTGKTLVFVITALEMLRRKLFRPQVMILVPTREIATQICSVIKSVGAGFPKLTCCSFIGGLSVSDDIENAMTCQIAVGTPGRLNQLITEKALSTNSVRLLVFDEADRLLQISFKSDITSIFNALPEDKQVIATSATYPEKFKKLLLKFFREPHIACLNSRQIALLGIIHYAKVVKSSPLPLIQYRLKLAALEEILKCLKFSQCLVFCNGIQRVEALYKDIKKWGFSTAYISSAKEQYDRLKAIDRLKHFKCKVLVSSDVTSRGIDAENVDLVINFDLAIGTETYMHRAGRAGRYGSVGVNLSIIVEKEVLYLKKIEAEGSFKTYKLPDPLPVDLIQSRIFEEYLIEETDSEEIDSDEDHILDGIKAGVSVGHEVNMLDKHIEKSVDKNMHDSCSDDTDCISSNQTSTEKFTDVSETAFNGSSLNKTAVAHLSLNGTIEDNCSKYAENIEVPVQKDICQSLEPTDSNLGSEFKNTIVNSARETPVSTNEIIPGATKEAIIFQPISGKTSEFSSENISTNVELDSKLSVNKCIGENAEEKMTDSSTKEPYDLNSEAMTEKKKNSGINKEYTDCLLEQDKNDKSIHENCESIFLSDQCPVNTAENDDLTNILTSDIFVKDNLKEDDLNEVIKTFLKEYESEKSMKFPNLTNDELVEESGEKSISVCAISDFNSKKYKYMYEVFTKYQNEMNDEDSCKNVNETLQMSLQGELCGQSVTCTDALNGDISSESNCNSFNEQILINQGEKLKNFQNSSRKEKNKCFKLVNENGKSVVKKSSNKTENTALNPVDTSEFEIDAKNRNTCLVEDFTKNSKSLIEEKPESKITPAKDQLHSSDEVSQWSSDDSSILNANVSVSLYSSSDSELDSEDLSSDSSESSSSSEENDDNYHHNQFRSGKQNPSLVSNSSSCGLERKNKSKHNTATFLKNFPCDPTRAFPSTYCTHKNPSIVTNVSSAKCSGRSKTKYQQYAEFFPSSSRYSGVRSFHPCSYLRNHHHPWHASHRERCTAVNSRPICRAHGCEGYSVCSIPFEQSLGHICHCDTFCDQMQVCCHSYNAFYSQWRHLQNCIKSVRM